MKCYKHHVRDAVATCKCGNSLCPDCQTQFNAVICENCYWQACSQEIEYFDVKIRFSWFTIFIDSIFILLVATKFFSEIDLARTLEFFSFSHAAMQSKSHSYFGGVTVVWAIIRLIIFKLHRDSDHLRSKTESIKVTMNQEPIKVIDADKNASDEWWSYLIGFAVMPFLGRLLIPLDIIRSVIRIVAFSVSKKNLINKRKKLVK